MDISKTSPESRRGWSFCICSPISSFGFGDPHIDPVLSEARCPCNYTWTLCIIDIQHILAQEYFEHALVSDSQFCNYDNFGDGLIVWLNLFHLASMCLCFFRSHGFRYRMIWIDLCKLFDVWMVQSQWQWLIMRRDNSLKSWPRRVLGKKSP